MEGSKLEILEGNVKFSKVYIPKRHALYLELVTVMNFDLDFGGQRTFCLSWLKNVE